MKACHLAEDVNTAVLGESRIRRLVPLDSIAGLRRSAGGSPSRPRSGVVLIDCPPQLGKLTPNALFAAGELIVPISMIDRGAYSGAAELLAKVGEVRKRQELRVLALVRTQVDRKRRAYRALNSELASLRATVAETEIPLRSAFHDAGVMGQPVMLSGPDSPGACAYRNLAAELANPRLAREAA